MFLRVLFLVLLCLLPTSLFADDPEAFDPTIVAGGARIFGMGRAFTAVANHADTIFCNPAGIVSLANWQASLTAAHFYGEIEAHDFSFALPINDALSLGFGYLHKGISDIGIISTSELILGRPDYGSIAGASFDDSTFILGLGVDLFSLLNWDSFLVSAGLNLKIFDKTSAVSGTGSLAGFHASGMNLDAGLLANFSGLRVGLAVKNIVSSNDEDSFGALTWTNGYVETFYPYYQFGLAFETLEGMLTIALDAQYQADPTELLTGSFGTELGLADNLFLRVGFDRIILDPSQVEDTDVYDPDILRRLSLGAGIIAGPFMIDYAFYPDIGFANEHSHLISLTFQPDKEKVKKKKPKKKVKKSGVSEEEYAAGLVDPKQGVIVLRSPKPEIVYEKEYWFKGIANEEGEYAINQTVISLDEGEVFSEPVALLEGPNNIAIGDSDDQFRIRKKVLLVPNFADVKDSLLRVQAGFLTMLGVLHKDPNNNLYPKQEVSLDEASLVVQSLTPQDLADVVSELIQSTSNIIQVIERDYFPDVYNGEIAFHKLTKGQLATIIYELETQGGRIKTKAAERHDYPKTVRALVHSGKYSYVEFLPQNAHVTRADLIRTVFKTDVVQQRIINEFADYPVVLWAFSGQPVVPGYPHTVMANIPWEAKHVDLVIDQSYQVMLQERSGFWWGKFSLDSERFRRGLHEAMLVVTPEKGSPNIHIAHFEVGQFDAKNIIDEGKVMAQVAPPPEVKGARVLYFRTRPSRPYLLDIIVEGAPNVKSMKLVMSDEFEFQLIPKEGNLFVRTIPLTKGLQNRVGQAVLVVDFRDASRHRRELDWEVSETLVPQPAPQPERRVYEDEFIKESRIEKIEKKAPRVIYQPSLKVNADGYYRENGEAVPKISLRTVDQNTVKIYMVLPRAFSDVSIQWYPDLKGSLQTKSNNRVWYGYFERKKKPLNKIIHGKVVFKDPQGRRRFITFDYDTGL